MSDEWSSGKLDLDAYLRRIGYTGPLEPSAATLAALHRAHLAAIRFENLDIMLGRGVDVDLDSIQAKLVAGRRGGYCYTATYPESWFTWQPIVVHRDPGAMLAALVAAPAGP